MKTKEVKSRRKGVEHLIVKLTKGESLDYAQAEALRSAESGRLLPFSYEEDPQGEALLAYDITSTVPLGIYLKADLSLPQFHTMLHDVVSAFEECGRFGLDPERLLCDPKHLKLDARSNRLLFAYLPAHGLPSDRDTAMDLLRHIAERASFVCKENRNDAEALLDYLKRQTVFSAVDFKEFLGSAAPEGARPKEVTDPGSSTASHGAARTFPVRTAQPPAAYDFVKAQSGALSACEERARQTLAERVASDVAGASATASAAETALSRRATEPSTAADTASPADSSPEPTAHASDPSPKPTAHATSLLGGGPTATQSATNPQPSQLVRLFDGARFPVASHGRTTIGRSRNCAVHLTGNPGISRHHATLDIQDGTCFLVDEGALNRTYLDGVPLEPHARIPLERGAIVRFADEEFRFE